MQQYWYSLIGDRSLTGTAGSNPAGSICCECCVLPGRGLCDRPIPRPEASYRMWCVIVCEEFGGPGSRWAVAPMGEGVREKTRIHYLTATLSVSAETHNYNLLWYSGGLRSRVSTCTKLSIPAAFPLIKGTRPSHFHEKRLLPSRSFEC
jgi:hypothetical protein